jgi:nicotinate-nucleotide--dimethylbenzimidazole phosphoribosyltransferase
MENSTPSSLQHTTFAVPSVYDPDLERSLINKINSKTKPLGALGMLEELALRIGLIQKTTSPVLRHPHVLIFAGDHGIARAGVSAYPAEVTYQMVLNFIRGGAAINVFSRQHHLTLKVIDAGVNGDFDLSTPGLIHAKVAKGTKDFSKGKAMTLSQAREAIDKGAGIVHEVAAHGCNVIAFGEMGIGNTSAASALTSVLCHLPIETVTGSGTGLDDEGVRKKINVLQKAIQLHGAPATPLDALSMYGGFEIAEMVGAILSAAAHRMVIVIDGFIATAAYLVAHRMEPRVGDYTVFAHQSGERGHRYALDYLGVTPLLNLNMRLGEGSGAAIAYPILDSAVRFLEEMASFESAGVSTQSA